MDVPPPPPPRRAPSASAATARTTPNINYPLLPLVSPSASSSSNVSSLAGPNATTASGYSPMSSSTSNIPPFYSVYGAFPQPTLNIDFASTAQSPRMISSSSPLTVLSGNGMPTPMHDSSFYGGSNFNPYVSSMPSSLKNELAVLANTTTPRGTAPSYQSPVPMGKTGSTMTDAREEKLSALAKSASQRVRIQELLEQELRKRYPFRDDWQKKCHDMALQLEDVLFHNAKTLEEYLDESTVSLRLTEVFMAKRKMEIAKDREAGDEVYNAVLEKARTRWLSGEEILVLLLKCSRKLSAVVTMNDSAFLPQSGSIYHFSAAVIQDGYNWLKSAATDMLQEHRFFLTVGGHPRVGVALNVDIHTKMQRRTYWLADSPSVGVLVHYLSETPGNMVPHAKTCFCLACLFKNNKEQHWDVNKKSASLTSEASRQPSQQPGQMHIPVLSQPENSKLRGATPSDLPPNKRLRQN